MNVSRPLRVAHVSSAHPYTDNRVHYRECNSLAEAGYEVALIAVQSPIHGARTPVHVTTIPKRSRLKRMIISSAQAVRLALRSGAPIIHMHDPELIPYVPLLRLLRRRVIYDAHEDLPTQVLSKSYLSRPAAVVLSAFARMLVRVAATSDLIVCATETIAERFPSHKTIVVHNYPPLREDEATAMNDDIATRRADIVYVGGIATHRGAGVMVDAMSDPHMPDDWRLRLAGTMSESLRADLAARPGWGRVDFEGQVPPETARDIILRSRVGLVLFADLAAHRDALPTKMFEYFAAGVPVVGSDFPLWRSIVVDHDCGILVDPASPRAVADAIHSYAADPEMLSRHSRNARRLAVEELNWAKQSEILVEGYRRLHAGPHPS